MYGSINRSILLIPQSLHTKRDVMHHIDTPKREESVHSKVCVTQMVKDQSFKISTQTNNFALLELNLTLNKLLFEK